MFDAAKAREEEPVRRMDPTPYILDLMATDAFKTVMLPALDRAEERRLAPRDGERGKRNKPGPYSVHDLFPLEAAARAVGKNKYSEFWEWLTGDFARPFRRQFGFDRPRQNRGGGRPQVNTPGIPSLSVQRRYREDWFVEEERHAAWRALDEALVWEKFEADPELMRRENEVLMADGSVKETNHVCPKKKDGVVVNEYRKDWKTGDMVPAIFCPEGGFIPNRGHNETHAGNGFNWVSVMNAGGTVLPGWSLIPLNDREPIELLRQAPGIGDFLRRTGVSLAVMTADAGFNAPELREALHEECIVENIHIASHGPSESTEQNVNKRDGQKIRITGHPDWFADGHRRLHCVCGCATFVRRVRKRKGGISVSVEGNCDGPDGKGGCGPINITAGRWHLGDRSNTYRLARPGEKRDWAFGNFLTYHDPIAKAFGNLRHSFQEGFFASQMTKRFKALEKRYIRRKRQGEIDIAISLCLLNAASIKARRAVRETSDPPPLALAA